MKILIATKNPGKFLEIRDMLSGLEAEFVSLKDIGIEDDFEETGETFEENALGKARFYHSLSDLPTVSDDSGLIVEALAEELGVKTRRWGAGEKASDEEWFGYFMKRMAEEENRRARFVCVAAYVHGQNEQAFFGETAGEVTLEAEAPLKPGIPLSSVFKPIGHASVYAGLSDQEKNKLSHRGKAFEQLLCHLKNA